MTDPLPPVEPVDAPGVELLRTERLVAGYTDVNILHGVDLTVRAGEIVSIIGPNGAGKSTFIKAVAGLLRVRDGHVFFDDDEITGIRPHIIVERGVAYVPQLDNIFQTMTVEENLEIGGFIRRDGQRETMEQIYSWLPALADRRRARAATLSGGQRQMLALGRALMSAPRLLMLDEPSAGLAPAIVDDIFERIKEINRAGLSILLVEQNARRALAMSHRGYVLDLGLNRFEGPGRTLLEDPRVAELYLGGTKRLETDEIQGEAEPIAPEER